MRNIFLLLTLFCVIPGFSQWAKKDLFLLTDQDMETGDVLRRYDIKFEYNEATLLSSDTIFLDSLANFMNTRNEFIIEIGIHYNLLASNSILSKKRAKTIKSYLEGKHVDPEHLQTKSYGDDEPFINPHVVNKAKTERERDSLLNLNSRIEFYIVRIDPTKQKLFTLKDTVFYPGSVLHTYSLPYKPDPADIDRDGRRFLDSIADFLKHHPGIRLQIGVHNTIIGVEYDENHMAKQKLTSISNYLIIQGITADRFVTKYYAEIGRAHV